MALADLTAAMKTDLQDGLTRLHTVLDQRVPELEQLAAIADHPLMQAVENALPVVPGPVLDGIAAMLNAVTTQHAASAEPAPEQPAETQPAEQPAA